MGVRIGHAAKDENGQLGYENGVKAGDQTGAEVCIREWYSRPWNKLIRAKNSKVAEKIAATSEAICLNNNIGYNQTRRTTLYNLAKEYNWDISKITTPCECDCSSKVSVCVNAAGVTVSRDIYTGNEASALLATGQFEVYTDSKYLTGTTYLKRGDILLKEGSHTAVVLDNGSSAKTYSTTPKWVGEVYNCTALNVRTGPGTNYGIFSNWSQLGKGNLIDVCDEENGWYYIRIAGKYFAWASAKYIKAVKNEQINVGDKVKFIGKYLYTSAYSGGKAVAFSTGEAVVQKIYSNLPHPYHLKMSKGGDGFANSADVSK